MRLRTIAVGLALVSVAGCGTASNAASASHAAGSSGGVGKAAVAVAVSASSRPDGGQVPSTVPAEFVAACGKPGTDLVVTHVPVTVKHRDCDLTGVTIRVGEDGSGAVVPEPGGFVNGVTDVSAGNPQPAEINISVDAKSGDVTITD